MDLSDAIWKAAQQPSDQIGTAVVTQVPSGGKCRVNQRGVDETVWYPLDLASSQVGDVVALSRPRAGAPIVIGRLVAGANAAPPMLAVDAPGFGTSYFPAVMTRSYLVPSNGDYVDPQTSPRVMQGSTDGTNTWLGTWAYQVFTSGWDVVPLGLQVFPGATATGAKVLLHRESSGSAAAAVHVKVSKIASEPVPFGVASRSDGPLTIANSGGWFTGPDVLDVSLLPGESRWVDLPAAWVQVLANGYVFDPAYPPSVYGLCIDGDPFLTLHGIDTDPESGLLRIDWTRP